MLSLRSLIYLWYTLVLTTLYLTDYGKRCSQFQKPNVDHQSGGETLEGKMRSLLAKVRDLESRI